MAALPHLSTGEYSAIIAELEAQPVAPEFAALAARAKAMSVKFNEVLEAVKTTGDKELLDLACRHLYELAAYCIMTQLLLRDATKNAAMFGKSLKVFVNYAEAEVAKHYNFVKSVDVEAMESYRKA